MPVRNTYKAGDHLFVCQQCGFTKYGSEVRLQWNGLRVCAKCYDPRHPQEYLRGRRDDQTVPFANPPAAPHFLETNEVTPESL
jgi:hypothetical protein